MRPSIRTALALVSCVVTHAAFSSAQTTPTAETPAPPVPQTPPSAPAAPIAPVAPVLPPIVVAGQPAPPPGVPLTIASAGPAVEVAILPAFAAVPPDAFVQWTCHTPCNLSVPAGTYQFVFRSPTSRMIRTLDHRTPTAVRVTPSGSRGPGIAMIATGGGLAVLGITFLVLGLEYDVMNSTRSLLHFNTTPFYAIGAIGLGVGLALAIPGIFMFRNAGGRVDQGALRTASARRRGPTLVGFGAGPYGGGAAASVMWAF